LRSLLPVVKCNASSNQIAAIVVTCGRRSGRTVANQYVWAVSSCLRAFSHGVGIAPSLLYRGSNSPTGILSAMARFPLLNLTPRFSERRADRGLINTLPPQCLDHLVLGTSQRLRQSKKPSRASYSFTSPRFS
jgi:hypothetical protein